MRDVSILLVLITLLWLAWQRPWVGVLGLAMLSYLHPQGYSTGLMQGLPAYQALLLVIVLATVRDHLKERRWPVLPRDWRIPALALLWAIFLFTTWHALAQWAAWHKLWEVAKILPVLLLTLLLIDSRRKLFWLMAAIALSIGMVVLKGGYWMIMTGFRERVYGPPGSQFYGNNEFAVACCMAIPLLVLWLRETTDRTLRVVLIAGIALAYGAVLSSWSRGGLLSLAVLTLLLVWHSRRKALAVIPLLVGGAALGLLALPGKWFDRMRTIVHYQGEGSAESRLELWRTGIDHALAHPLTGGGFEGWQVINAPAPLDWHSAYVEVLAEHGMPGLAVWLIILFGSMLSLSLLARRGSSRGPGWVADHARMLRASLASYAISGLFLGIAYWELLYQFIAMGIVLSRLAMQEGCIRERPPGPSRGHPAPPATGGSRKIGNRKTGYLSGNFTSIPSPPHMYETSH